MKPKMKRKSKKQKIKINFHNWKTTDGDEVERRKARALLEKFKVENIEESHPYFSTYHVSTRQNKSYTVEIRSLDQLINSCNCPDYRSNTLGTCKHIEKVLLFLRKKGALLFKQAIADGNNRIEIFLDPVDQRTIRIQWPKITLSKIKKSVDCFFSTDGSLLGESIDTFEELQNCLVKNKFSSLHIRLSQHIDYFIEYHKVNSQKQHNKNIFLKDVESKKRTLNLVKHALLPYQEEGMLHLAFTERALLADEMGLGKTVQSIAACELLRQSRHIQRVLVVTTASLKAEWEEQIAKFTDLSSLIIFGTRPYRLKQYQKNAFFYLMNYEQVVSDHAEIQRLLAPDVVILDEAQRIKNWQTKTANAVKQLKSRYAFVLTGTPVENRIDDIYSLVQFLDPHIFGPLFRFNRNYYELDDMGKAVGYKRLDELYRSLRPIMLCRKKSDVEGELPKRLNNNYFIEMDMEQRIRYEEYEKKLSRLLFVAKHRPLRKEEFERMQRWLACMRMICDTPYILDKDCRISPKLNELENILEELLVDPTVKILIFSEWERMLFLVREMVEKNGWEAAWHTGSVPQHKRREDIHRFKNDKNCRLFLSTDSGSVGLNLQAANVVINLDLPWNPAKLEQRIARAWRKHQTRSVQAINLICENSIEHRMLYLLKQKQLLADGILTGNDGLSEMKMPSGRAAFMERMNELIGDSAERYSSPAKEKVENENDQNQLQKMKDKLFEQTGVHVDLLPCPAQPNQEKSTLLAICENHSEELEEKLKQQVKDEQHHIEFIDRKTFEAIQKLIDANILSSNIPLSVLQNNNAAESKKTIQQKQINNAKQYLSQAERKQKMAQILMKSGFADEIMLPLKSALDFTLRAHISLIGEDSHPIWKILARQNIEKSLVKQHGLPEKVLSLFSRLEEGGEPTQNVEELYADHSEIIFHVTQMVDKAMVGVD